MKTPRFSEKVVRRLSASTPLDSIPSFGFKILLVLFHKFILGGGKQAGSKYTLQKCAKHLHYLALVYSYRRANRYDEHKHTWVDILEDSFLTLLSDHGLLRLVYGNTFKVCGGLYRTNQPGFIRLYYFKHRYGVRSVINLRGGDRLNSFYRIERLATEKLGLHLHDVKTFSRGLLKKEGIENLLQLIQDLELPAIVHCKSGADRTGQFCALYRYERLGEPICKGKAELSPIYGHFRHTRAGVLDYQFEDYLQKSTRDISLKSYYRQIYNPVALQNAFDGGFDKSSLSKLVERLLNRE